VRADENIKEKTSFSPYLDYKTTSVEEEDIALINLIT
jgi:hypothetical protein